MRVGTVSCLVVALLVASPAAAQPDCPLDEAEATLEDFEAHASCLEEAEAPVRARAAWLRVAERASTDGDDALAERARARHAALASSVGRLVVHAQVEGRSLRVDGRDIPADEREVDVPPDRAVAVEVTAPGRRSARREVTLAAGEERELLIRLSPTGAIADDLAPAVPLDVSAPAAARGTIDRPYAGPRPSDSMMIGGGISVGLGVALAGAGIGLGVAALLKVNGVSDQCDPEATLTTCTTEAIAERNEARPMALAATGLLAGSFPALAFGLYALVTYGDTLDGQTVDEAPEGGGEGEEAPVAILPVASPTTVGLSVTGAF